jgi:hypothetical protein
MKFSEIANRLTGISTPFGGASWQPAEMEVAAARRVIAFLEDRRVLYEPGQMEVPSHCVHSVIEIRHRLSDELGKLDSNSELGASLRAMRATCHKFLERVGTDGERVIHFANDHGRVAHTVFFRTRPVHTRGVPHPSLLSSEGWESTDLNPSPVLQSLRKK